MFRYIFRLQAQDFALAAIPAAVKQNIYLLHEISPEFVRIRVSRIHKFVDVAYWQLQCDLMIEQFKQKAYTQGIVDAIDRISDILSRHFPIQPDDVNELSNEVIING